MFVEFAADFRSCTLGDILLYGPEGFLGVRSCRVFPEGFRSFPSTLIPFRLAASSENRKIE